MWLFVFLCALASTSANLWSIKRKPSQDERLTTKHSVRIELTQRNIEEFHDLSYSISDPDSENFGKFLSATEIRQIVGQPDHEIEKVRQFFDQSCNDVCEISLRNNEHGDYIFMETCLARVECMFNVEMVAYEHSKHTGLEVFRSQSLANPSTLSSKLSTELSDLVFRTMGVTDLPVLMDSFKHTTNTTQEGEVITPMIIRENYGTGNYTDLESDGPQSSQAVAEFQGEYFIPDDLLKFQQSYTLPINNITNFVGNYSRQTGIGEASLDVQYITTVVNLETWDFVQDKRDFVNDLILYLNNVAETPGAPLVHSISYGMMEKEYDEDDMYRMNNEFAKLTSSGFTFIVASGDRGPWGDKESFSASFPATSPYVTAVGATFLHSYSTKEECTVGWSGSGFSDHFARPLYQNKTVNNYLTSGVELPKSTMYNSTGRAIPDVSAYGTNFVTIMHGQQYSSYGTSASCPVFASMVTYANALRQLNGYGPLGNINPRLYKSGSVGTDITCGYSCQGEMVLAPDNGIIPECFSPFEAFYATKGWDVASGLGTPIASQLFDILAN